MGDLVKERWADSLPDFEVFSKIERVSRKLRHLKASIKTWIFAKRIEKGEALELIKQKIAAIDLLAKVGNVDDRMINERADLKVKLGSLVADKLCDLKQKAKVKWL